MAALRLRLLPLCLLIPLVSNVGSADWPQAGRDATRNPVSPEKNAPLQWAVKGGFKPTVDGKGEEEVVADQHIRWKADLGSSVADTGPVVAGGLVWIGANIVDALRPRDKDASVLRCFRESDGRLLYEYLSPRPDVAGGFSRPPINCAPLCEGDRIWFTTNHGEVVCLDVGPLQRGAGQPTLSWKLDLRKEFNVFRHTNVCAWPPRTCSISASYKNRIYVTTGHGTDPEGKITVPGAPSLLCLDRDTGKLLWKDSSPGADILGGQFASPLVSEINGRAQVIAPQGDGWVRSFDALTGKLLWKCNTNPPGAKEDAGVDTNNHLLATPVLYESRIYFGNGHPPNDPRAGASWLYCLDPTRAGDISPELVADDGKTKPNPNAGVVWRYGGRVPKEALKTVKRVFVLGSVVSSCVIHDGLLYLAEERGYFHCLDARSGKPYWVHDLKTGVLGSPLCVDGKVYLGTQDGNVFIYSHGKERKDPRVIFMDHVIASTPVFANGVLYIATSQALFAIQEKK